MAKQPRNKFGAIQTNKTWGYAAGQTKRMFCLARRLKEDGGLQYLCGGDGWGEKARWSLLNATIYLHNCYYGPIHHPGSFVINLRKKTSPVQIVGISYDGTIAYLKEKQLG